MAISKKEYLEYMAPHFKKYYTLYAANEGHESDKDLFTFFDFGTVKSTGEWQEFINDYFDYGEFNPEFFNDEGDEWVSEEFMPIAELGVSTTSFEAFEGDEADYIDGQTEGLILVKLDGNKPDDCPIYCVDIDGTSLGEPPRKIANSLQELLDTKKD